MQFTSPASGSFFGVETRTRPTTGGSAERSLVGLENSRRKSPDFRGAGASRDAQPAAAMRVATRTGFMSIGRPAGAEILCEAIHKARYIYYAVLIANR